MNSSTFRSCSCDSSAPAKGSGIPFPQRGQVTSSTPSRASVQDPQPSDIRSAVVALHRPERLHAARLLAGVDLRLAQAQLGVLGTLEAALLDALLDEGEPLFGLAF